MIAGYVLSQEGRKWVRLWYQVKQDLVLYKFKAHEVRQQLQYWRVLARFIVHSQYHYVVFPIRHTVQHLVILDGLMNRPFKVMGGVYDVR